MRIALLVTFLLFACSQSSAVEPPVELGSSAVYRLPDSIFPDTDLGGRDVRLVARDDSALVLGLGGCIGKIADRCLSGSPVLLRGREAPRQLSTLRRPPSLLWPEFRSDGALYVQRLPEAGEPEMLRLQPREEGFELLDIELPSNPTSVRSADGGVLIVGESPSGARLIHATETGEREIARGDWFDIDTRAGVTYARGSGEAQSLLSIAPDGLLTELVSSAESLAEINVRESPEDRRHYCMVRESRATLLVLEGGQRLGAAELGLASCPVINARIDSRGAYWIGLSGGELGDDTTLRRWSPDTGETLSMMDGVVGAFDVRARGEHWLVLDEVGLVRIDLGGSPRVLSEFPSGSRSLHVRGERVALRRQHVETGRTWLTLIDGDTEVLHQAISSDEENLVVHQSWLGSDDALWMTASIGFGGLPSQLLRATDSGVELFATADSFGATIGTNTLLVSSAGVFVVGNAMERIGDADARHRDIAPGLVSYLRRGEHVLASWDGVGLVELATSPEAFDVIERDGVVWVRHTDAIGGRQRVGRFRDGVFTTVLEVESAQWVSGGVRVRNEGQVSVCLLNETAPCIDAPFGDPTFYDVQVTQSGRLFALLRDDADYYLWYSLMPRR